MKLEVRENMYCRTRGGAIGKIVSLEDVDEREYKLNGFYIGKDAIKKASYSIIDILEVGDYVNGYKIGHIDDCKGAMREFYYDYENPNEDVGNYEEEIKSVITHEQIEQMEYIIGE
jgi:hypothetical protein